MRKIILFLLLPFFLSAQTGPLEFDRLAALGVYDNIVYRVLNGVNPDIDASDESITFFGDSYGIRATPEIFEVWSGSGNDDVGNGGANYITIEGLDTNRVRVTEQIAMNGVSKVLTSNKYHAITLLIIDTVGYQNWNSGDLRVSYDGQTTTFENGGLQIEGLKSIQSSVIGCIGKDETALFTDIWGQVIESEFIDSVSFQLELKTFRWNDGTGDDTYHTESYPSVIIGKSMSVDRPFYVIEGPAVFHLSARSRTSVSNNEVAGGVRYLLIKNSEKNFLNAMIK